MVQIVSPPPDDPHELGGAPIPPQALEAEQSVIGSLLLQSSSYDRIEFLKPEHFYSSRHRKIYETIVSMIERNQPVDALTVKDAMGIDGGYLGELVVNTVSVANIYGYAKLVKDRWMLRQIQAISTQAASGAFDRNADAKTIAESAEAAFLAVLDDSRGGEEIGFDEAVKRAVNAAEAPEQNFTPTGLNNLDRMLKGGGMRAGQLIVIAGRPSMGKSAFAWNIAERVALTQAVAGFTLEMSAQEVAERSIAYHSGLTDRDRAAMFLMELKLRLDDSPAVTLAHIRLRSKKMKRRYGLGLIVVDYLQLMDSRGDTREQEISKLSRGLKAIAKDLQVPVIAVAQINRGVEQRQDKRPMLSDLRESGAIEQDADIVLMLYRDEYYNEHSEAKGLAEAIIRKQRGGKVGTAWLSFSPETTRFHDYSGPAPQYAAKPGKVFDFKSKQAGDE